MKRVLFFLIVTLIVSCQSSPEDLPVLSYKIDSNGNKEVYAITYSNFTDQNGEQVSNKTINDKIIVANFFFTQCPSICPPMRMQLIDVANEFIDEDQLILISHSIDIAYDTVSVLKTYSENTQIPSSKWLFITSNEENTKNQAKQFMTNFKPKNDGTDFYHSSYAALVDKNQMIRGFYNILITEEVQRLKVDIKTLLK